MNEDIPWKILDKYFKNNPSALVNHHLESYNDFFNGGINQIFREKNPIKIVKLQDPDTKNFKLKANIYLGGKDGNKIYYGKPIIFDEYREHYMYPNEARLRNMTYGVSIHYDVDVDYTIEDDENNITETSITLDKIFLGRFPIMLMSDLCILKGFDKNVRYMMGECRNDIGGYFIISGKEKVIISQEKFADNMLYIRDKVNEIYSHSAEIRSVSEDASKPIRTLSIRIVAPSATLTNNQIVVNVPNVRKPVPLFILMRALGIISDKSIIETCFLDIEKYSNMIDLLIPSIHDAGKIFTQEIAIKYIATFTKGKTVSHVLEILMNYLLPNIGELNFRDKACFIGYMVFELLKVFIKVNKPTDRDSFKYKRVELPGSLIYDLFKEYYTLQQRNIYQKIDKEYYYKQGIYQNNFTSLIQNNYTDFFKDRIVEDGFRKAFKGNWGAETHTKREGIVQDVNRLSFNSYISLMRKINLPLDSSAKVVGPRLLHSSQWGIIDPVDTPDGGNIGLHKHMSILTKITKKCSNRPIILWLRHNTNMLFLNECSYIYLSKSTKVFVNGAWIGIIDDPEFVKKILLDNRRSGLIPIYTSISWDIKNNTIFIYTDSGRLCHPVYYINDNTKKISIYNGDIINYIQEGKFEWNDLISGFSKKKSDFDVNKCNVYLNIKELYDITDLKSLENEQAIIEYIDTSEKESALICINESDLEKKNYTHMEIHPSLIFGVMGNQIIFPENNQLPRDLFSCGQSKQAVSLYHSNFHSRIDKSGLILNYGQIPIVKSRYMKYINNEEHPYGENVIVAISCYGGYNVEDSILFNEASIHRGLFATTYYNMYESREESSKVANSIIDSRFANIEKENVVGLKPGYDYSNLDENGLIKENTQMDDKKVVIGKVLTNLENPDTSLDSSSFPKKGQLGFVDKAIITEGEEGFRLAKVRIRENRIPTIGDKFCSRCGQKGTIGLIIPERDMPTTEDGIRPDIIINPHALPSRMTIGQLVETIMGKACTGYGVFGDCTAFLNKGSKYNIFGKLLTKLGFHSSGNELLYNGQTGEQMDSAIFIGPTYYMRLKHMVKDKINYRAHGPRTVLTRQTVQGRANDGGLRIGELERDALIGHGLSAFLQDSMLVRGDQYYMAICNLTGIISIYNDDLDLFMSPMADGPIKFTGTLDNNIKIENISKYGRNFSIVRIPYAFKLLLQELATMNIVMRIITEDNINQLSSMSFSGSIDNLQKPTFIKSNTKIRSKSIIEEPEEPEEPEELEESEKPTLEKAKTQQEQARKTLEREKEVSPTKIRMGDQFEQYQIDIMKNLTRQQNPDSIKIGEDTTFEPDKLQSTKVDDLRVTKTVRSIDQNDAIPDMQEPLIKSPQQPKPPLVLSPELQEKQPSTVTNKSPLNEVVVVGSDPTKIEVDTKEMEVLPTLTDVVENKSEIDKKEEEKNIKEVVTSS
uniref:DNA-directed RNA polymerase n=1 Tax=viral metagenome TaxID=1070528 RepID=A0A6C0AX87_9ZZZZ|tara:strand:- start:18573 stop:22883 length:4311 start_codon:yes stop_codon:yes gene_type:complete